MILDNIGFYTLSDERAKESNVISDLSRCELILTDKCNFHCPYCKGVKKEYRGDISIDEAFKVIDKWASHGIQNIRFSGGEPTLYPGLLKLIYYARSIFSIKNIAISTNGSADWEYYKELIKAGVTDFSVSLDACCSDTFEKMSKTKGSITRLYNNIMNLSSYTYTTVGIVLTPENENEVVNIIGTANFLGVKDIRVIPAAQYDYKLHPFEAQNIWLEKFPIFRYRYNNLKEGKSVRGLNENDNPQCPLVLDDMAVIKNHHYPCIIYLREQGEPIGEFSDIEAVRFQRHNWFTYHDVYRDPICHNNCLDVCREYNNRWREFKYENRV